MNYVPVTQTLAQYVAGQLRAEIARQQKTRAEVARLLGENETWVGKRLNGRIAITVQDLERFAQVLGLPVAMFIAQPVAA